LSMDRQHLRLLIVDDSDAGANFLERMLAQEGYDLTWERVDTVFAFFTDVDGCSLGFSLVDGTLVDDETQSVWNDSGKAISGQLKGLQLEAVPSRTSYWFSLVGSLPDIELHSSK